MNSNYPVSFRFIRDIDFFAHVQAGSHDEVNGVP